MARNRKRAKDRRARRPQGASVSRPGGSGTRVDPDALDNGALAGDTLDNAAPNALEHAAPDAELAEAQLAVGRPELAPEPGSEDESGSLDEFEAEAADAADAAEFDPDDYVADADDEPEPELVGGGGRPPRRRRGGSADGGDGDPGAEEAAAEALVPATRPHAGSRLINFVQGSWRELQRVQWPDRRQVMQATGVVIGFVVVAGVFLGVADFLAGKLVNFILK